jgi:structure-specific endonuclease subunit SLX1
VKKRSRKTGKEITKTVRPSMSLESRLHNLHLLLRSKSFERWPLSLRFFCEDVHKVFMKHSAEKKEQLRSGIEVVLDENASRVVSRKKKKDAPPEDPPSEPPLNPIELMDFEYSRLRPLLEKSIVALDPAIRPTCSVCKSTIEAGKSLAVVCPHDDCAATSHLHCLSANFLRHENNSEAIVPLSGDCPSCHNPTSWDSVVRELSLRIRGQKQVEQLFKKPRSKKGDAIDAAVAFVEAGGQEDGDDLDGDGDESEAEKRFEEFEAEASMIDMEEYPKKNRRRSKSRSLEIKDSDWDDVDVLD